MPMKESDEQTDKLEAYIRKKQHHPEREGIQPHLESWYIGSSLQVAITVNRRQLLFRECLGLTPPIIIQPCSYTYYRDRCIPKTKREIEDSLNRRRGHDLNQGKSQRQRNSANRQLLPSA